MYRIFTFYFFIHFYWFIWWVLKKCIRCFSIIVCLLWRGVVSRNRSQEMHDIRWNTLMMAVFLKNPTSERHFLTTIKRKQRKWELSADCRVGGDLRPIYRHVCAPLVLILSTISPISIRPRSARLICPIRPLLGFFMEKPRHDKRKSWFLLVRLFLHRSHSIQQHSIFVIRNHPITFTTCIQNICILWVRVFECIVFFSVCFCWC